jgi:uncharacterized protein (TIGR02757 family)
MAAGMDFLSCSLFITEESHTIPKKNDALQSMLDRLYTTYHTAYLTMDPLEIVRRYKNPQDQEIVGFIAAALAIGRVEMFRRTIENILQKMGTSPHAFIRSFDSERDGCLFREFRYRFYNGRDLGLLMAWLHRAVQKEGSLQNLFMKGYEPADENIGPSLSRFVKTILKFDTRPFYPKCPDRGSGIRHFLADPQDGSGCKRLNLFLRWMIRNDGLDLGIWKGIRTSQLIIPLDTHITRIGRRIGLTQRKSPDWKMAVDITRSLRLADPLDPVKYDFALCRLGMIQRCPDTPDSISCAECPACSVCIKE